MNTCAICGQPMKFFPAGFSRRTQKSYNAFYACADKSHKQPRQAPTPTQQFSQKLDEDIHEQKIQKAVAEKRESISLMNAKNNATLLLAHEQISENEWEIWVKKIHDFNL